MKAPEITNTIMVRYPLCLEDAQHVKARHAALQRQQLAHPVSKAVGVGGDLAT
jgi:hypothetical protein